MSYIKGQIDQKVGERDSTTYRVSQKKYFLSRSAPSFKLKGYFLWDTLFFRITFPERDFV